MLKFSRNAFQKNTPLAWSRKGSKYTLRNWLRSEANWKTRISIRHVGIYVQVQSAIDRTAVPFSSRQRTTKVALVKATKHKPNTATDEVRVENRNHGLAWSNENERTFQSIIYPAEKKNVIGISNISSCKLYDYILQYILSAFSRTIRAAIVLHLLEDKVAQRMLGSGKPIDHEEFWNR